MGQQVLLALELPRLVAMLVVASLERLEAEQLALDSSCWRPVLDRPNCLLAAASVYFVAVLKLPPVELNYCPRWCPNLKVARLELELELVVLQDTVVVAELAAWAHFVERRQLYWSLVFPMNRQLGHLALLSVVQKQERPLVLAVCCQSQMVVAWR